MEVIGWQLFQARLLRVSQLNNIRQRLVVASETNKTLTFGHQKNVKQWLHQQQEIKLAMGKTTNKTYSKAIRIKLLTSKLL